MSSPPPSASSPTGPSFTMPKKRPAVTAPKQNAAKRRKPSEAPSSGHPLRQTSWPPLFPPEANSTGQYSPTRNSSFSPSVSSVGAAARGVGAKKKRRDARSVTDASVAKGGAAGAGKAGSTTKEVDGGGAGRDEEDGEEDENDGADDTVLEGGGVMNEAAKKQEREHLAMLIDAFSDEQADRYDMWRRVRLKKETVRRMANQSLSQSVPASVVTTINGYTKLFIGELVERARDVQLEWLAAKNAVTQARAQQLQQQTTSPLKALHTNGSVNGQTRPVTPKSAGKPRPTLPAGSIDAANMLHGMPGDRSGSMSATSPIFGSNGSADKVKAVEQTNTNPNHVDERDRGPLTPDHLREALRRYKKDREGGSAGVQGLSLQLHGRELAASRVGGKRLFR